MSDVLHFGNDAQSLEESEAFLIDKVSVYQTTDDEENVPHTAGKGKNNIDVEIDWYQNGVEKSILSGLSQEYKPFEADGVDLGLEAEIGDTVEVGNVHSVIWNRDTNYGTSILSKISAPHNEEIESEYSFYVNQDKKISRRINRAKSAMRSEFSVTAKEIRAEVSKITGDISALKTSVVQTANDITLSVASEVSIGYIDVYDVFHPATSFENGKWYAEWDKDGKKIKKVCKDNQILKNASEIKENADAITAKVSYKEGTTSSTFGWELTKDSWRVFSKTTDLFTVTKDGAYVKGEIVAKTGRVGGFAITSSSICSYTTDKTTGTNDLFDWDGKNVPDVSKGVYIGKNGIALGQKFSISTTGVITAKDGDFTGKITASSGKIGNWEINSAGNLVWKHPTDTTKQIVLSISGGLKLGDKFTVSPSGKITATGATITGTVKCDSLYVANGENADGTTKYDPIKPDTNKSLYDKLSKGISGGFNWNSVGSTVTANAKNGQSAYNSVNKGTVEIYNLSVYNPKAGEMDSSFAYQKATWQGKQVRFADDTTGWIFYLGR